MSCQYLEVNLGYKFTLLSQGKIFKGEINMKKIKVMRDSKSFKNKKEIYMDELVRRMKLNEAEATVEATVEEIANLIIDGYAIRPAVLEGGACKENWKSQQMFMLDIDNDKEKGGKDYKFIDIQSAYEYFKSLGITPVFIYKSYSYSEAENKIKFRMVFVTNQEITNVEIRKKLQATLMGLLDDVGNTDIRCKDENRVFLGTSHREILYSDFEAEIDAQEIISKYWKDNYRKFVSDIAKTKKDKNNVDKSPTGNSYSNDSRICTNLDYIKAKDYESLHTVLGIPEGEPEEISSFDKIEPQVLLGVEKYDSFLCPIHEERHPSASIIYDKEKDMYVFCCPHDADMPMATPIYLIQLILDCSKFDACEFISKALNVTSIGYRWMVSQRKILMERLHMIETFEIQCISDKIPLDKDVFQFTKALINIMLEKLDYNYKNKNEEYVLRISRIELMSIMQERGIVKCKDKDSLGNKVAYLALLGIIDKVSIRDLSEWTCNILRKKKQADNKNTDEDTKREQLLLHIPVYDTDKIKEITDSSIRLKEIGFSSSNTSQKVVESLTDAEGVLKVYPELYDCKEKLRFYCNIEFLLKKHYKVMRYIKKEIERKGYVLQQELCDKGFLKKEKISRINEILILLENEHFVRRGINADVKKMFPELEVLKGSNNKIIVKRTN